MEVNKKNAEDVGTRLSEGLSFHSLVYRAIRNKVGTKVFDFLVFESQRAPYVAIVHQIEE